jgi:hypothetical protein
MLENRHWALRMRLCQGEPLATVSELSQCGSV